MALKQTVVHKDNDFINNKSFHFQKRKLDKERESEVDNKYIVDALNRAEADDELRERARYKVTCRRPGLSILLNSRSSCLLHALHMTDSVCVI